MARAQDPLWLARPSRYAGLARSHAIVVAAGLVFLVLVLALAPTPAPATGGGDGGYTDLSLYETVIDGMRAGGGYYQLLADSLRAGGYPLRPFLTFRLPTHAAAQALIPREVAGALLLLLAFGVAAAWWTRLAAALSRPAPRIAGMILLAGGMIAFVQRDLVGFHEIWAGPLVALSLALRAPGRWVEAVALGLIAVLVRETAALYLLIMAGFAWRDGARQEASGWLAALGVFALAMAVHAWAVSQVTGPLDPRSPGWTGLLGPGFVLEALAKATALQTLPALLASVVAVLALIGWTGWRDPLASRVATMLAAYALAVAVFARADTFYWVLMIAPLWLTGLVFVPDIARDLTRAILDRRRVRVQRTAQ